MFFWNKFCGLAFFIFNASAALPAQDISVLPVCIGSGSLQQCNSTKESRENFH